MRSPNNGNKIVLKIVSQKVIENEDPFVWRVSIKYVTALKEKRNVIQNGWKRRNFF